MFGQQEQGAEPGAGRRGSWSVSGQAGGSDGL